MGKNDAEFLKRLLATFQVEAAEHLKAISSGLLELEREPAADVQQQIIENTYREVHSLKGAARTVNLAEIETVCHSLENTFAALKRQEIALSGTLLDELHDSAGRIERLLAGGDTRQPPERPPAGAAGVTSATQETSDPPMLQQVAEVETQPGSRQPAIEQPLVQAQTVRIAIGKLDALLLQAEELLATKLASRQHVLDLQDIRTGFADWKAAWVKVQPLVALLQQTLERSGSAERPQAAEPVISQVPAVLEFLDWNSGHIKALENRISALTRAAERDHRSLGGMVDGLLAGMKQAVMLPFSWLLEVFPTFVRQLARDQGKQAELVIQGGEIEIDRRILEELKDSLIHLVRNSIDHGIETPEARIQQGKPARGSITVAVSPREGNQIEVLIADDGAGINLGKVISSAVKLGILPAEEAEQMTEPEALALVFHSEVSTSPIITDISGRGIGLAIVREKIEKIGGSIALHTAAGTGTSFRMLLPLTLATFRGILVQAGEQPFVVPATSVERVARVKSSDIKTIENRETIQVNGQAAPLVHLEDILELPRRGRGNGERESFPVFVLAAADRYIAFRVDQVLNEQEVLVKSLGKQLSRVRNIAGATVMGNGQVVAILNVHDLIKSATKVSATPRVESIAPEEVEPTRKSILVAEDSITARTLLKNILESSGYIVKTTVDGIDAYTELRSGDYDLVVTDVDMPRMSGFDLTAKIRAHKKYSQLPVVLVTALDSRQDRERGIDVGANAYIVKSSFDQSNLLEVIRRLV